MTTAATADILHGFRPLAIARDFDDLRKAFRDRCDHLNVARATVDKVGGLPDGQTAHLLAPVRVPDQEMGRISMPAMLGALGLALIVVEDTESIARIRHRLTPRNPQAVNMLTSDMLTKKRVSRSAKKGAAARRGDSQWGRIMAARRLLAQSQRKRSQIARLAARARWAKRRRRSTAGATS